MRAIFVIAAGLALAAPAAALEPDAVRAELESRYPVEVLNLEPGQHEGRAVYQATVMVRAGDYNDALRVSRLLVDATSGVLLPPPGASRVAPGPDHRPRHEGMEGLRN